MTKARLSPEDALLAERERQSLLEHYGVDRETGAGSNIIAAYDFQAGVLITALFFTRHGFEMKGVDKYGRPTEIESPLLSFLKGTNELTKHWRKGDPAAITAIGVLASLGKILEKPLRRYQGERGRGTVDGVHRQVAERLYIVELMLAELQANGHRLTVAYEAVRKRLGHKNINKIREAWGTKKRR